MSAEREPQAAARALRELGNSCVGLGRRVDLGLKLIALGKALRSITPRQLAGDDVTALRRPLDDLRGLLDTLAVVESELRILVDGLTVVVGVDN